MEWSGVEWSGVEWSEVKWSGVEWSGVARFTTVSLNCIRLMMLELHCFYQL